MKSNKILFITSNQQYSFTFARNEKHSQYEFKPPYNTMQAIRLLQYNNPSQNQSQTSQVQCLQVLKSNKGTQLLLINKFHSHLQEIKNTPNMYLNHLITSCKPLACSNTTTHHKTNFQHHKYNAYKYWNRIKEHNCY